MVAGPSGDVVVDSVITEDKLQVRSFQFYQVTAGFLLGEPEVDSFTLCYISNHQMEEDKDNFTVVSQGRLDSKQLSDVEEQAATVNAHQQGKKANGITFLVMGTVVIHNLFSESESPFVTIVN